MAKKIKLNTEEANIKAEVVSEKNLFNSGGELVVDVFETHTEFVVLTAIAGVGIKDLDISVEKEMMVIKGDRLDPHDNPENPANGTRSYFYQECYWGPFSRKIILPENIRTEEAEAQMEKGVLTIKIPKITTESMKDISTQAHKKEQINLS